MTISSGGTLAASADHAGSATLAFLAVARMAALAHGVNIEPLAGYEARLSRLGRTKANTLLVQIEKYPADVQPPNWNDAGDYWLREYPLVDNLAQPVEARTYGTLKLFLDEHGIKYNERESKREVDGGRVLVVQSPFTNGQGICFVRCKFYCYREKGKTYIWKDYCKALGLQNPNKVARTKSTVAAELMVFADQHFEFAQTPEGNLFETHKTAAGILETSLVGNHSREALIGEYRKHINKSVIIPPAESRKAWDNIMADARVSAPVRKLHLRVANHDGNILIDTGNAERNVIVANGRGWEIRPPLNDVAFLRTKLAPPIALPQLGGNIQLLKPYLNVAPADFPLVSAWIVATMRPESDFICPPLEISGPPGHGKTTIGIVLPEFSDPKFERKLPQPSSTIKDQLVCCQESWVVVLNNISKLDKGWSDFLCCLVDGTTITNRKLFTDGEMYSIAARRPVIITSVQNVITASDLADRAISIEVPIDLKRESPHKFWKRFDEDRPFIMGALLDGLVAGLKDEHSIILPGDVRLSGFLQFAEAAGRAWGYPEGTMYKIYTRLQATPARAHVEASVVGTIIVHRTESGKMRGTIKQLFSGIGLTPREVASELRSFLPDLKKIGIRCSSSERDASNVTIWEFERT